jgi:hypothetical protein
MMNQTSEEEGGGGMQAMEEMEGMDMEQTTMEAGSQQNAIVITAATILPEFSLSLPLATAVGFSVIVFILSQK